MRPNETAEQALDRLCGAVDLIVDVRWCELLVDIHDGLEEMLLSERRGVSMRCVSGSRLGHTEK